MPPFTERRRSILIASRRTRQAIHAITDPASSGSERSALEIEPLAGMLAARDLELAARDSAIAYIREARESGHSWHRIGASMCLIPGADPQQHGTTLAQAAYTYAAGNPGIPFVWACRTCENVITDHGPGNAPADTERGHAGNCAPLQATTGDREHRTSRRMTFARRARRTSGRLRIAWRNLAHPRLMGELDAHDKMWYGLLGDAIFELKELRRAQEQAESQQEPALLPDPAEASIQATATCEQADPTTGNPQWEAGQ